MLYKTLTGIGTLWVGDKKVAEEVPYRVTISRDVRAVGAGLWQIEGEVDAPARLLFQLVAQAPSDLELELSDGARWGCMLQNSNGRLLNTGRRNLPLPE
jgi:hypothetical protein